MILKTLAEVVWKVYQNGNPKADRASSRLSLRDVMQLCRTTAANNIREQYQFGQKLIPGRRLMAPVPEEGDYALYSPLLSVNRFDLPEADELGMRRADMEEFDLYRLPKNIHFTNLYMVNAACAGFKTNKITLVQNGEEKFYAGNAKFTGIVFASVVGRGVNTFNVPPCIKSLDIETTYDSENADITMDIAFDVATIVLRMVNEQEQLSGDDKIMLTEELKKREDIK